MNKKTFSFFILIAISLSFLPSFANATEDEQHKPEETITDEMFSVLELDEMNDYWEYLQEEYRRFLPDWSNKSLIELIKNNESISLPSLIKGLITYILYEIVENGKLLSTLIVLALFSVVLQTIISAFGEGAISKIAQFVIFSVLIYIALQSFYMSYSYTKDVIDQMSGFMIAVVPLLLAIISSLGQFISVAFFHPLIVFLIQFSSVIITYIVFPLLYISALLMIVSQLNDSFKLDELASLFRTIGLGVLGVYVTGMITVMSIQGTVTAIQDGVALKTTKFIAGNFIPVIGKTMTDATDTILASALLLKNAIGVVGLIIIVTIAIFPAIKIAVIAFIYKLVSSLLQPLGDRNIVQSLSIISQYMMYVLACLIFMTFMFFLTVVIIVVSSNLPLLLR